MLNLKKASVEIIITSLLARNTVPYGSQWLSETRIHFQRTPSYDVDNSIVRCPPSSPREATLTRMGEREVSLNAKTFQHVCAHYGRLARVNFSYVFLVLFQTVFTYHNLNIENNC